MQNVIEVEELVHRFGSNLAVNDFSFTVRQGEVLALLGPNGAGKTTTVRLINGLFPATAGKIRLLGLDPVTEGDRVRSLTGVLTETPALYERLTAWQNIEFFGTLEGMPEGRWRARGEELLRFFDLDRRASEKVSAYSKGMKQRLALARALLGDPPVLFLDEPTAGLDPEAALQVHDLIRSIREKQGQTVVLCTHNLLEAQRLSDRMAILYKGQMLAMGSLEELRSRYAPGLWVQVQTLDPVDGRVQAAVQSIPGVHSVEAPEQTLFNIHVEEEEVVPLVVSGLVRSGIRLLAVKPREVSLEDVYFQLQNQAKGGVC